MYSDNTGTISLSQVSSTKRFSMVESIKILQGTGHPVHGLGETRVGGQGKLIFGQGAFLLAFSHQIKRGIVMVLSFLGETINIMTLGGLALAVGILATGLV